MKKLKKSAIAMVSLLVLVLVAGTFAYWNQTATIENPFDTGKYGTTIIENFRPEEGHNWQPGVEVDKDVFVQNTGDQDIIVRVKLDEAWTRKDESVPYKSILAGAEGEVYTVGQGDPGDGSTGADLSVVTKTFNTSATKWINGNDGWYYYAVNLKEGISTEKWLDSVELLYDVDLGQKQTIYSISIDPSDDPDSWEWIEYDPATYADGMPKYYNPVEKTFHDTDDVNHEPVLRNKAEITYAVDEDGKDLMGYSASDYVLTVTVQTVQATKEAIDTVFGAGSDFTVPTGCSWVMAD